MRNLARFMAVAAMVLACISGVQAEVVMVTVGDPGNAMDTRYPAGGVPGFGGVAETYNIGKYEVTNSQYCEFLNAVANADPYGLYNPNMGSGLGGITRGGSSPNYTYNVIAGRGNMPVNYVSWYDTLRFANWMHNGQGSGDTEDGAYDMSLGSSVVRKPDALVFLPTEDEWYKAAYYKGGGTNAGYWDCPTQSDNVPTAENPPGTDMINGSANHSGAIGDLTNVGAYTAKPSDSAYGTFDQGGNAWEWNETDILGDGSNRGHRGGALNTHDGLNLLAASRNWGSPALDRYNIGFRVAAEVPDCNENGILDSCDIDCGDPNGPCDVPGCGESLDCNGNLVPDECEELGDDYDQDGIPNDVDVCPCVPSPCGVDAEGRPLGDLDYDCDVDLADFLCFQVNYTGPM